MKPTYIKEPDSLQCGQAVLAMITERTVDEIVKITGNPRELTLSEMKNTLRKYGFTVSDEKVQVFSKEELPDLCFLSLETPRCWHWSLYADKVFYDPEHGVMDDFPVCKRKYYWKVSEPV